MKSLKTLLSGMLIPLAMCVAPAWGALAPHPGLLNYVEGQARINGQVVTARDVGSVDVREGQVVETGQGKAEVLLTPGVFLRLGENSAVRLDAAGLADTRMEVLSGKALVEADDLRKANNIRILDHGAVARLEKNGLYSFSTSPAEIATLDGKAQVTENDSSVEIGKGHEASTQVPLRSTKFDRTAAESDGLYQWSRLRSGYLSEADIDQARTIVVANGWMGDNWYWNPWYGMYSWIPGDGAFFSPFGWGFYSPFSVWSAPGYYRGFRGYRGGGVIAARPAGRAPIASGFARPMTSVGGARGFSGGGFGGHGRR